MGQLRSTEAAEQIQQRLFKLIAAVFPLSFLEQSPHLLRQHVFSSDVVECLPGYAFGLGHEIICEMVFQELDPGPRERVKSLVQQDQEFRLFSKACAWPDHPRIRRTEHYVNLKRDATGIGDDPCPVAFEMCSQRNPK